MLTSLRRDILLGVLAGLFGGGIFAWALQNQDMMVDLAGLSQIFAQLGERFRHGNRGRRLGNATLEVEKKNDRHGGAPPGDQDATPRRPLPLDQALLAPFREQEAGMARNAPSAYGELFGVYRGEAKER